jgi:hypothetical protein
MLTGKLRCLALASPLLDLAERRKVHELAVTDPSPFRNLTLSTRSQGGLRIRLLELELGLQGGGCLA